MSVSSVRSIHAKLLIFPILLLALPWLGYQYLNNTRAFLIEGQVEAMELMARGFATVLQNRTDLFNTNNKQLSSLDNKHAFYVFPLETELGIDGYLSDWGNLISRSRNYPAEILKKGTNEPTLQMKLVLAVHKEYLFGAIQVSDDKIIYRHPGYRRLDNSDHLRLDFIDSKHQHRHMILLTEAPGIMSIYEVTGNGKYALNGRPITQIRAYMQQSTTGYNIEFRMPLNLFNKDKQIRIGVADVDNINTREVIAIANSTPADWLEKYNRMIVRSNELESIIAGSGNSETRIWVVDRHRRVRGLVENSKFNADTYDQNNSLTDYIDAKFVTDALAGNTSSIIENEEDIQKGRIISASPIMNGNSIPGAIVLEKQTSDILIKQRTAFWEIAVATLFAVIAIIAGVLLFSYRLAYRIQKIGQETASAIDEHGRLTHANIRAETDAKDELGVLSRDITGILQKLSRYTHFLESFPRTLRHEINNPLNSISTSLQNLAETSTGSKQKHYIESSERGIKRLSHIMNSLTDAANLEDGLRNEEIQIFNLTSLIKSYTSSYILNTHDQSLKYTGTSKDIFINGSNIRIEQLLDKLLDNAFDFAIEDSLIEVDLKTVQGKAELSVINEGPSIVDELLDSNYLTMKSIRSEANNTPHLGVGLYMARLISEHHGGTLHTENIDNKGQVKITVTLPIVTK